MAQGLEGLLTGHTLVKRYKIEEVCGRGGFAVVYRATDTRLGRPVAVKVITLTAEDPEEREVLRQRLHREARAAASLPHHPNLVTVHDVGTDPELGLDFLVMELLQGENLSQALQGGRPPLPRALRILRDAAEGLAVGHRAGLVHRDVKPGNIFLASPHGAPDPDGFRVCLLDYGIAQAIEDDQTVTRGMGANPLSPAFASPEQLRGDRDLSPATDVFSLGVVGYQLLTGERPFTTEPGQMPTGWTVRTPLRELNPEVAPAVEAVVMRAMSVDAKDRYVDADAFVDALDSALGVDEVVPGLAARAHSPGIGALPLDDGIDVVPIDDDEDDRTMIAPAPVAAAASAPHRPVPPLRPPPHAAPRKRSALPLVLIVALLLAGVAAWAVMRGGGEDASLRSTAGTDSTAPVSAPGAALDDGAVVGAEPEIPRTGPDVDVPAAPSTDGGGEPAGGQPSAPPTGGIAPPSGAQPSPGGQASQPQPGAQQPQVSQPRPQQPQAQPQQPAARPPVPRQPQPPPQRPPAQQPQPQRPPAAQPQPQQPQPQPQQPRPEPPPLLGRPVEPEPPPVVVPAPNPNAPRDTIRIGNPR
jgi:serine/threonine protein kinase